MVYETALSSYVPIQCLIARLVLTTPPDPTQESGTFLVEFILRVMLGVAFSFLVDLEKVTLPCFGVAATFFFFAADLEVFLILDHSWWRSRTWSSPSPNIFFAIVFSG